MGLATAKSAGQEAEPPGQPPATPEAPKLRQVSIFSRDLALRGYMRHRREKDLAFGGWRTAGCSADGKTEYYANRRFDWKVYIARVPEGYEVGIAAFTGKLYSMGMEYSRDRAVKLAKIVMDFVSDDVANRSIPLANAARRLMKTRRRVTGQARVNDKIAWVSKGISDIHSEYLEIGGNYIREMYSEVAEQVREKFGTAPPRLRMLRGMHHYDARYSYKGNSIGVPCVQQKEGFRITLLHEFAHAVAWKKYNEKGHGYYFLQIYKVLTGRDYFKKQDGLLAKLRPLLQRQPAQPAQPARGRR